MNSSATSPSVKRDGPQNAFANQVEEIIDSQRNIDQEDKHHADTNSSGAPSHFQKLVQENQNDTHRIQQPEATNIPPFDTSKQKNHPVNEGKVLASTIETSVSVDQAHKNSMDELVVGNGSSSNDDLHSATLKNEVPASSSSLIEPHAEGQIYSGSKKLPSEENSKKLQEFCSLSGATNRSNTLETKVPNGSLKSTMVSSGSTEFGSPLNGKEKIEIGLENVSPITSKPEYSAPLSLVNGNGETIYSMPQHHSIEPTKTRALSDFSEKTEAVNGNSQVICVPQNENTAKLTHEFKPKDASPQANCTRDSRMRQSQRGGSVDKLMMQSIVENAVDDLREEFGELLQNLHIDMLRQFQSQSDEMNDLFRKQGEIINALVIENKELREENDRLRSIY
eukprot:CAMPEP_0196818650 /NCGR_PEP_ID=MMETSP1362-20130617/66739_1 /TAXON_ID=163516 /ORGANISM="Leptocylindrus danicus, Strain CCMP1856" /LENGTH=393 /DNA_ID=CAMNT_0042196831 /DNA_START=24 /DNA_END=1205 /DNA_ORIENTATION=-